MMTLTSTGLALLLAASSLPGAPIPQRNRSDSTERSSRLPRDETDRLRSAIRDLTNELQRLREELAASETVQRSRFEANVKRMELVTDELVRLKAERDRLRERQRSAQERYDDATYRIQNIQVELTRVGDVDRDRARERIETSLQRIADQAQTELREIQSDLFQVESQIESNELLLRTLKRRLKIDESQIGVEEPEPEPPPPSEQEETEAPPEPDEP